MRIIPDHKQEKIEEVIRNHHLAFLAEILGPSVLLPDEVARLEALGLLKKPMFNLDPISAAYFLGHLQKTDVSKEELLEFVSEVHLTSTEKEAITNAREKVGNFIQGLGDSMISATRHILTEAEEAARKKELVQVREVIGRGVEKKQTVKQITRELEKVTGDNTRDWYRIASTELHNAMEEGRVNSIVKTHGKDVYVFKRPRKDACAFCKLLYLDGNKPKIFKLSQLVSHGTNVNKKAKQPTLSGDNKTEWNAVVGSTHPFCRCSVQYLPEGMGFDSDGNMTYQKSIKTEKISKEDLDHECL